MLLDRTIREKIVEMLKASTGLVAVVGENIYDFPADYLDAEDLPAVSVFTLECTDNSEENESNLRNTLTVHVESAAYTAGDVDDMENLVNSALVVEVASGECWGGIDDVQQFRYASSQMHYDSDGEKTRFIKTTVFSVEYQSLKADETSVTALELIEGELVAEDDDESQINNESIVDFT